jgi:hypothetical protein
LRPKNFHLPVGQQRTDPFDHEFLVVRRSDVGIVAKAPISGKKNPVGRLFGPMKAAFVTTNRT